MELPQAIYLVGEEIESDWNEFKNFHKVVEAAGGLVFNDHTECLFIFRRRHWDLPKGKLEKGESPKEGAYREVIEECGFVHLDISHFLITTYHTYTEKGKRILKPTHWYLMQSNDALEELVPQLAEDILELKWASEADTKELFKKTFPMIPELYQKAISHPKL
jgi:8-oxo-dGTP pyrophosphatase MutT (NUDIX family)